MSYQVGSACYSTAVEAAQASASSEIGAVVPHGGVAYVVDAATVAASSVTYSLTPVGGGSAISVTSAYTAQPCNLMSYADGLTIGWAVAGAWLAAFALMFMARALRGETEGGSYGNA